MLWKKNQESNLKLDQSTSWRCRFRKVEWPMQKPICQLEYNSGSQYSYTLIWFLLLRPKQSISSSYLHSLMSIAWLQIFSQHLFFLFQLFNIWFLLLILVKTRKRRLIRYESLIDKLSLSAMKGEQKREIKSAIAITNRIIAISSELKFKSDKMNGVKMAKFVSLKK